MSARVMRRKKKTIMARDKMTCQICFAKIIRIKDATLDHIVSRGNGGTDANSNLQLACWKCNQWKNKHVDQVIKKARSA